MEDFLIFILPFVLVVASVAGLFIWGSKHQFFERD